MAALGAVAYFASFPRRLDYAAHLLAGVGVAGVALAIVDRAGRPHGRHGLVAGAVALGAATMAELTFTGPTFDLLDVLNTAMGGLLGVAAVTGAPDPGRRRNLVAVGAVLIAVGFILRYPVQAAVKHAWWFAT